MKAVILAAGYGTRMQRDIENSPSGRFTHLSGISKPLLPVGNSSLISYWVNALTATECVDTIYVITNALHQEQFLDWAKDFPNVKILSDGTRSNEMCLQCVMAERRQAQSAGANGAVHTRCAAVHCKKSASRDPPCSFTTLHWWKEERLGAVSCLQLAVKVFMIKDHVMIIGGDTLFREDFSLNKVKEKFLELQAKSGDSNLVLSYQCKDDETSKYGILEVNEDLRVLCMKEKPQFSETKSRRACPCFYILSQTSLPLLDDFLDAFKESVIEEKDAPGNFLSWLIPRKPVYTYEICGRFDVGNLQSYIECDRYFRELQDVKSYTVLC